MTQEINPELVTQTLFYMEDTLKNTKLQDNLEHFISIQIETPFCW